jgi:hypothetical protein
MCFVLGALCAGITAGYIAGGAASGEVAFLNQRYDTLNREYTERQRELEEQQRRIGAGVSQCIGYVENTRAIIERTGESASGAVANLREAVELIRRGIEERKNLEVELNNLRSGLYRLRDLAGNEIE